MDNSQCSGTCSRHLHHGNYTSQSRYHLWTQKNFNRSFHILTTSQTSGQTRLYLFFIISKPSYLNAYVYSLKNFLIGLESRKRSTHVLHIQSRVDPHGTGLIYPLRSEGVLPWYFFDMPWYVTIICNQSVCTCLHLLEHYVNAWIAQTFITEVTEIRPEIR